MEVNPFACIVQAYDQNKKKALLHYTKMGLTIGLTVGAVGFAVRGVRFLLKERA